MIRRDDLEALIQRVRGLELDQCPACVGTGVSGFSLDCQICVGVGFLDRAKFITSSNTTAIKERKHE